MSQYLNELKVIHYLRNHRAAGVLELVGRGEQGGQEGKKRQRR